MTRCQKKQKITSVVSDINHARRHMLRADEDFAAHASAPVVDLDDARHARERSARARRRWRAALAELGLVSRTPVTVGDESAG